METTRAVITLSIAQETSQSRPALQLTVMLGDTVVVSNRSLSVTDTEWVKSVASSFGNLFEDANELRVANETLVSLGHRLFDLWLGQVWDRLSASIAVGAQRLIVISSDIPEILNLPWELLMLPDGLPLSLDPRFRIRRIPSVASQLVSSALPLRPKPLRILFHACAPLDQEQLAYEQEEALLLREAARAGRNIVFESGDLGTFEELRERVNELQPHIVHLHGHGYVDDQDQGFFVFEDERGLSDIRSSSEIRNLLAGGNVQCVFVSGCQTGRAPEISAVGGICQGLVSDEIPLAVGWVASIYDDTAMEFGRVFCNTLTSGQPIDRALLQARQAIHPRCRDRDDPSWVLPVLYASTDQEYVVDPNSATATVPLPRPIVAHRPLPGMTEGFAELFVGRRRELQRLLPRLRDGTLQVVVVTGLARSGKSTLATRLARRLESDGFHLTPVPSSTANPLRVPFKTASGGH